MEHHVNLVHNIPFFSVFFAMFCGSITPLLKSGRAARHLHGFMVGLVGILSVVLLANVVKNQEAYTFIYDSLNRPVAMGKHRTNSEAEDDSDLVYADDDIMGKAITNHIRKGKTNVIVQPR